MAAADHYSAVTAVYETAWCYQNNGEFQKWMVSRVEESLPRGCRSLADVGCGTANFSAALQRSAGIHVIGIEPSQEMANKAAEYGIFVEVCDALHWASDEDGERFDSVMLKEVRHHITDPWKVYSRMAHRLNPGGRIMILTRPDVSRGIYPFPAKAHDAWAKGDSISLDMHVQALKQAGFLVQCITKRYTVTLAREEWRRLVQGRFWSHLHELTDSEIVEGLDELNLPAEVQFEDHLIFVIADLPALA